MTQITDLSDVQPSHVARARRLMKAGRSMQESARFLGITPSSILDRALWRDIGKNYDAAVFSAAKPTETQS